MALNLKAAPPDIQLMGYSCRSWHIKMNTHRCVDGSLPKVEDVWKPAFWAAASTELKVGDLIRIEGDDPRGEYDFDLVVRWVRKGAGVGVALWPIASREVFAAYTSVERELAEEAIATGERELGRLNGLNGGKP